MKISKVYGMQVLDSRGKPTVRAYVFDENGNMGTATVPSGASTGEYEAYELRDKDEAYMGLGTKKAAENITERISKCIKGENVLNQRKIDMIMCEADGTENKQKLGANAILAVSLACAVCGAESLNIPLYRYLGGTAAKSLPTPMLNVINGGAHAQNGLDIQEFMIYPKGFETFSDKIEASVRVYDKLKGRIGKCGVGDEGGFAPDFGSDEQALDALCGAIEEAGFNCGTDFSICLDAAASEWAKNGKYIQPKSGKELTRPQLIDYFAGLAEKYPISSIEDPLGENDFEGFRNITEKLGKKIQIVGDDLFVTNIERLKEGKKNKVANAILIKPNQIGTLSETLDTIEYAKQNGYKTIISHRSGDTADTFIADLSVAVNAGMIKTGAPARSERVEKYNRLLEIESEMSGTKLAQR